MTRRNWCLYEVDLTSQQSGLSAVAFGLIYSGEALNLPKAGRCMIKGC